MFLKGRVSVKQQLGKVKKKKKKKPERLGRWGGGKRVEENSGGVCGGNQEVSGTRAEGKRISGVHTAKTIKGGIHKKSCLGKRRSSFWGEVTRGKKGVGGGGIR